MSDNPEGKDGIRRNVAKLKLEWKTLVKPAIKASRDSHAPYTNAAVEACRAAPYFMGHVLAIGVPALIVIEIIFLYVVL